MCRCDVNLFQVHCFRSLCHDIALYIYVLRLTYLQCISSRLASLSDLSTRCVRLRNLQPLTFSNIRISTHHHPLSLSNWLPPRPPSAASPKACRNTTTPTCLSFNSQNSSSPLSTTSPPNTNLTTSSIPKPSLLEYPTLYPDSSTHHTRFHQPTMILPLHHQAPLPPKRPSP